ncbi:hypothetical protein RRG08_047836 [Elysia crispata]|uniref:Uncharacterized protein n=1 Tax=Elysia crispata TaxID=231223 RepID=A0AAE0ZYA8_9GAST|nr:hypothetical protein RRG08_047836 [Elysia crispata]
MSRSAWPESVSTKLRTSPYPTPLPSTPVLVLAPAGRALTYWFS